MRRSKGVKQQGESHFTHNVFVSHSLLRVSSNQPPGLISVTVAGLSRTLLALSRLHITVKVPAIPQHFRQRLTRKLCCFQLVGLRKKMSHSTYGQRYGKNAVEFKNSCAPPSSCSAKGNKSRSHVLEQQSADVAC